MAPRLSEEHPNSPAGRREASPACRYGPWTQRLHCAHIFAYFGEAAVGYTAGQLLHQKQKKQPNLGFLDFLGRTQSVRKPNRWVACPWDHRKPITNFPSVFLMENWARATSASVVRFQTPHSKAGIVKPASPHKQSYTNKQLSHVSCL